MCVNGWESEYPFSVNSYESEYPKINESGNIYESGKISSSVNLVWNTVHSIHYHNLRSLFVWNDWNYHLWHSYLMCIETSDSPFTLTYAPYQTSNEISCALNYKKKYLILSTIDLALLLSMNIWVHHRL